MVELKYGGFYGKDDGERCKMYRGSITSISAGNKYEYIYITGSQTSPLYREKAKKAFGEANCFFFEKNSGINSLGLMKNIGNTDEPTVLFLPMKFFRGIGMMQKIFH